MEILLTLLIVALLGGGYWLHTRITKVEKIKEGDLKAYKKENGDIIITYKDQEIYNG